ncbi:NmrA family NAD(P)-binding protein [Salinarimonas rosea]|uniref:NmrA family NAD(P)-binding protein n=1 Tax=Salinarimonas rosea TaxID=552063 RepID=UPI0004290840|nr:NmrA family NAD(P)-binding protein [Salinarimonas rosea]
MFLVTGLTGNTGAAVADTLLAAGAPVRALVRDLDRAAPWAARGVDLVRGDATSADDLAAAMEGVSGAYVLAPPAYAADDVVGAVASVGRATREAIERARPERLVFLSSEGAQVPVGTGVIRSLHAVEAMLAGAPTRLTFLRAAYFQENWLSVLPLAAAQGILPSMLDLARPQRMVATADIGRVAAETLLADAPPALIELAGPRDYAPADVAAAAARVLGRPVAPVAPPRAAWEGIFQEAGLRPGASALMAQMYDGIASGVVAMSGDVPLTRGRVSIDETLAGAAKRLAA